MCGLSAIVTSGYTDTYSGNEWTSYCYVIYDTSFRYVILTGIVPRTPGRARAKPARALVGGALKRDRPKSQSVCLSVGHAHVTIALRPITHKGAFMTSHSL